MKRGHIWSLLFFWLLACGFSGKQNPRLERFPVLEQAQKMEPKETEPEEPEIKAATPEDPGPIATVAGPLAAWARETKPEKRELPEVQQKPHPLDHVVPSPDERPKNFLHTVFSVRNYTQVAFVVPPHQASPRLHGNFRSFTERSRPDFTSDRTADVEMMLLNEQEFDDLRHGRPGGATFEVDASHRQMVDCSLPSTRDRPQQYHLVFHNSPGGPRMKFVDADFTVSFD